MPYAHWSLSIAHTVERPVLLGRWAGARLWATSQGPDLALHYGPLGIEDAPALSTLHLWLGCRLMQAGARHWILWEPALLPKDLQSACAPLPYDGSHAFESPDPSLQEIVPLYIETQGMQQGISLQTIPAPVFSSPNRMRSMQNIIASDELQPPHIAFLALLLSIDLVEQVGPIARRAWTLSKRLDAQKQLPPMEAHAFLLASQPLVNLRTAPVGARRLLAADPLDGQKSIAFLSRCYNLRRYLLQADSRINQKKIAAMLPSLRMLALHLLEMNLSRPCL